MKDSIEILLVEDNPGDTLLTQAAFKRSRIANNLTCVETAEDALETMRNPEQNGAARRPDMVLLDLNLPKMSGSELLKIVKADEDLKTIPVIVLTSSDAEVDIQESYRRYANSFITKPISLGAFAEIISSLEDFWFDIVRLPK